MYTYVYPQIQWCLIVFRWHWPPFLAATISACLVQRARASRSWQPEPRQDLIDCGFFGWWTNKRTCIGCLMTFWDLTIFMRCWWFLRVDGGIELFWGFWRRRYSLGGQRLDIQSNKTFVLLVFWHLPQLSTNNNLRQIRNIMKPPWTPGFLVSGSILTQKKMLQSPLCSMFEPLTIPCWP